VFGLWCEEVEAEVERGLANPGAAPIAGLTLPCSLAWPAAVFAAERMTEANKLREGE